MKRKSWDGVVRLRATDNMDSNLELAYQNSTVWFYQETAKKIGKEKYKKYLKEFSYGNRNLSGKVNDFWLDNTLTISPKEQVKFLIGLFKEKYTLGKRTYDIVKNIMIEKETNSYVLRAKTGLGIVNTTEIGWYVGYVETNENVYFFATRLYQDKSSENKDFIALRKTLTFNILNYFKFME